MGLGFGDAAALCCGEKFARERRSICESDSLSTVWLAAEEAAPHLTLLLERFPGNSLRQYPSGSASGATLPAGLVPVQLARTPQPPPAHRASLPIGLSNPPLAPGELPGLGLPAIPAMPAAATVLSIPAAITMPPWVGAVSAPAPISFRSAPPPGLQQVVTPALVLSPGPAAVAAPPVGQLAPAQWGAPVENVFFAMGVYERNQSRRRLLRRRVRLQDV